MPSLFDLLSNRSDKDALKKLQQQAQESKKKQKPSKKKGKHDHNPKGKHGEASKNRQSHPTQKIQEIVCPDFVALDLETTGLHTKNDRITEIGACLFINGEVAKTYSTLVNPQKKIPPMISELTGITDDTVKDAPLFADVAQEVVNFIGDYPFCGHQIDFDFSFINEELKRNKLKQITNPILDTAALSRLLLPELSGYSLSTVSESLDISLENAHRALDDAKAAGFVACKLVPMLNDVSPRIRRIMGQFAPASELKTLLIKSAGRIQREDYAPVKHQKVNLTGDIKKKIKFDKINASQLEEKLTNYTSEVTSTLQKSLYNNILNSLSNGQNHIAELPSPDDKGPSYLLPSALWALENNGRIVISVNSKNRHDELLYNELPKLKDILGEEFHFSSFKSKNNYLCRKHWSYFLSGRLCNLSQKERLGIMPLIKWAEETTSGDINEQNQFNPNWYLRIWSQISAASSQSGCNLNNCRSFDGCFYNKAREAALRAHVVIVTHGDLIAELSSDNDFMENSSAFIFDEAHRLEIAGHHALKVEVDTNRQTRLLDRLTNLQRGIDTLEKIDTLSTFPKEYKKILKRFRKNSSDYLLEISTWANKSTEHIVNLPNGNFALPYTSDSLPRFSGQAGLLIALDDLQTLFKHYEQDRKEHKQTQGMLYDSIMSCQGALSQLKADIQYLSQAGNPDHTFWCEGNSTKGWIKICGTATLIGNYLQELWKQYPTGRIFTAEALITDEKAQYFTHLVGLLEDSNTTIESYENLTKRSFSTLLCQLEKLPSDSEYATVVANTLIDLLCTIDTKTLVLFKSKAILDKVYNFLSQEERLKEVSILSSLISGNRGALLEQFKNTSKAVLLGLGGFWEGNPLSQYHCKTVVIAELPLESNPHPLNQAVLNQIDKTGNALTGKVIPEGVLKLKQLHNRLDDQVPSAVIHLDNTLNSSPYYEAFYPNPNSLTVNSVENVLSSVKELYDKK